MKRALRASVLSTLTIPDFKPDDDAIISIYTPTSPSIKPPSHLIPNNTYIPRSPSPSTKPPRPSRLTTMRVGVSPVYSKVVRPPTPPPKRVRWERSLKEECEDAMEKIHRSTQCYTTLRLVTKVMVHIANGTETSSNALHTIEMMRGGV